EHAYKVTTGLMVYFQGGDKHAHAGDAGALGKVVDGLGERKAELHFAAAHLQVAPQRAGGIVGGEFEALFEAAARAGGAGQFGDHAGHLIENLALATLTQKHNSYDGDRSAD